MKTIDRFRAICSLDFIEGCSCQFCLDIIPRDPIYGFFKFSGTDLYLYLKFIGDSVSISYFIYGCPYSPRSYGVDFDRALINLPENIQDKIIYNITLFR